MTPYANSSLSSTIPWSTRIYVLLGVLLMGGAWVFNAWHTNWALAIAFAVAGVLLAETIIVSAHRHPRLWQLLFWGLLLALLGFLLIG
ncbi:MAG: hypothetical protein H6555_02995 [Lewinellaceae bacterium]|nr:hypothetical protein [Lewinellaceae bacterium]